jgi:hypothetical protein
MNYFKSVLAGLAAVFVICVFFPALPTIVRVFIFVIKHGAGGMGFAIDRVSWHLPSPAQSLFLLAVFGGGFVWELRRLAKRRLAPSTERTDPPIS